MARVITICSVLFLSAVMAYAEQTETFQPLRDLPPQVQTDMARLAEILSSAIKSGRLSDAQVQAALNSGDAPAMIRGLGPEAAGLLQDISGGFKEKYTDEELNMILAGLIGSK